QGILNEVSLDKLVTILLRQEVDKSRDINSHFNPTNYLISPFNSTSEFIEGRYFLTIHQEKIKKEVVELISNTKTTILSIRGKAGTGKTLLTYDIAKHYHYEKRCKVLIIHCGNLNVGHIKLKNNYKWHVIAAKEIASTNLPEYELIIVDESQRIYP